MSPSNCGGGCLSVRRPPWDHAAAKELPGHRYLVRKEANAVQFANGKVSLLLVLENGQGRLISRHTDSFQRVPGMRKKPPPRFVKAALAERNCPAVLTGATELIEFFFSLIFLVAVFLLEFSDKLILLPGDDIEVVVGQLAPLFLHLSPELFPVPFDLIPIHDLPPVKFPLTVVVKASWPLKCGPSATR
jgi:hypothetical protein